MNLVVVYLTKVREHIIIPERYIHGFNVNALKNLGNNPCRDQLVYSSDECIEGQNYPDPNPDAIISENWPAGTGAWYYARTIYYTDDINEAEKIKEKRRKVLPGIYNPSRLSEKPLPMLVLVPDNEHQQSDEDSNATDPLEESNDGEQQECDEDSIDVAQLSTSSNESHGAVTTNMPSGNDRSETSTQTSTNLEPNDGQAESVDDSSTNLQSNDNQAESVGHSSENQVVTTEMLSSALNTALAIAAPIKNEPVFTPLGIENQQAVDDVFNNSYETCDDSGDILVCTKDVIPLPIGQRNPYEVKKNDILCGNMPYATNDAGDRAFMVSQGHEWKQFCLTDRVVKGLTAFNTDGFRTSIDYDKKFIKVLLVSCIGINKIQSGQSDPFAIEFIQDLYAIRCAGTRVDNFDALVKKSCDEIVNGKYN